MTVHVRLAWGRSRVKVRRVRRFLCAEGACGWEIWPAPLTDDIAHFCRDNVGQGFALAGGNVGPQVSLRPVPCTVSSASRSRTRNRPPGWLRECARTSARPDRRPVRSPQQRRVHRLSVGFAAPWRRFLACARRRPKAATPSCAASSEDGPRHPRPCVPLPGGVTLAAGKRSWWAMSHGFTISKALPNKHFAELGLESIEKRWRDLHALHVIGPAQLTLGLG